MRRPPRCLIARQFGEGLVQFVGDELVALLLVDHVVVWKHAEQTNLHGLDILESGFHLFRKGFALLLLGDKLVFQTIHLLLQFLY